MIVRRIVVFAHYDKDNIIEDYVIYYLKGLKEVAGKIVFVSDGDISDVELEKLQGLTICNIVKRHREYDFGSYKRGFLWLIDNKMLDDCDELIFANDSCYAPLYPFREMFDNMSDKYFDFWGVTKNLFGLEYNNDRVRRNQKEHIQSYFIVFKNCVINSRDFIEFISNIKQEVKKTDIIINYEIELTSILRLAGFKYGTYARDYTDCDSPHITLWKELIAERVPFVKTSLLRLRDIEGANPIGWRKKIALQSEYPIELIEKDLARNISKVRWRTWIKVTRQWIISVNLRRNRICILGKCFKIK